MDAKSIQLTLVQKDKISILFSSDENYIRYCAVTITSILLNASHPKKLHFYILSPDCSNQSKEKLETLCSQFDAEISIIRFDLGRFRDLPNIQHFSLNAYSRLYGAEVCQNAKRLLYLDSDLIVLGDVEDLFAYELSGKPLGAVPHVQFPYQDVFVKTFDIKGQDVFLNSGVLLFDANAWRRNNYGDLIVEWASKNADKLYYPDQDALNSIFWRNYCHLPGVWNVEARLYKEKFLGLPQTAEISDRIKHPKIIHYTGSSKPWSSRGYIPRRRLYSYFSNRLTKMIGWLPKEYEPQTANIDSYIELFTSSLYFRASQLKKRAVKNIEYEY